MAKNWEGGAKKGMVFKKERVKKGGEKKKAERLKRGRKDGGLSERLTRQGGRDMNIRDLRKEGS